MPSFFTTPASQRKRKREGVTAAPSSKKRNTNIELISKAQKQKPSKAKRDESISGSESEAGDGHDRSDNDGQEVSTDSEDEDETGAERRLRLAERYLESIKNEVNETGFDAEDIDRDLIADRLQQDVVCSQAPFQKFQGCSKLWIGRNQRTAISSHSVKPRFLRSL